MKKLIQAILVSSPLLFAQEQVFNGSEMQTVNKHNQEAYKSSTGTHTKYGILVVEGKLSKSEKKTLATNGIHIEGVMKLDNDYSHYLVSSDISLNSKVSSAKSIIPDYYNMIPYKRNSIAIPESSNSKKYNISFFKSVSDSAISSMVQNSGATLVEQNDNIVTLDMTSSQLSSLLLNEEVMGVEEYSDPMLLNDLARERTKVDDLQANINFNAYFPPDFDWQKGEKFTGHHVDIGIYDTGVDTTHFDFREVALDQNGNPIADNGPNSFNGELTKFRKTDCSNGNSGVSCSFNSSKGDHGTHVAGIAGANGWNSDRVGQDPYQLRGVAPKVSFWPSYISQFLGKNSHIGHVTNHSYVSSQYYNSYAGNLDNYLRDQDFGDGRMKTVVYAAGNEGGQSHHSSGRVHGSGYYSLVTNSKNALVVGMANKRTGKVYAGSSIGPTVDGRIKPDIVTPGASSKYTEPTPSSPTKIYIDYITIKRNGTNTPVITYDFNNSTQSWGGYRGTQNINSTEEPGSLYYEKIHGLSFVYSAAYSSPYIAQADDQLEIRYKIELGPDHVDMDKMAMNFFWFSGVGATQDRYLPFEVDVTGNYHTLTANLSQVVSSGGFSWTPGEEIYRIRVDFNRATDADGIISTLPNNNGYGGSSGTSMAAPHAAGIVALMTEKYGNEILACELGEDCGDVDSLGMRSSLSRALLIHTATDLENDANDQELINNDFTMTINDGNLYTTIYHAGPDFATGWGLANAEKAVEYVNDSLISRTFVEDGEEEIFHFRVTDLTKPFRVTATWDDLGSSISSGDAKRLINDIDMHLIAPDGEVYYPWQLEAPPKTSTGIGIDAIVPADIKQATNTCAVDFASDCYDHLNNVEVIDVTIPQHGDWKLVIKGTHIEDIQEVSLVSDYELRSENPRCWQVTGWSSANLDGAQALIDAADCTTIPSTKVFSKRFIDDNYLKFNLSDSRIINPHQLSSRIIFYGYESGSGKPIFKTKSISCSNCNDKENLYYYPPLQGEIENGTIVRLRDPDYQKCIYNFASPNYSSAYNDECINDDRMKYKIIERSGDRYSFYNVLNGHCLFAHNSPSYAQTYACTVNIKWLFYDQGLGYRARYHYSNNQCLKGSNVSGGTATTTICADDAEQQYQFDVVEKVKTCGEYGIEDAGNGQLTYYYRDQGWAANGFSTKICFDTEENCWDATKVGDFYTYTTSANYGVGATGSVKIKVSDDTPPGQFISELHSVVVQSNGSCLY